MKLLSVVLLIIGFTSSTDVMSGPQVMQDMNIDTSAFFESEYAELFDLYFTYDQAQDLVAGFSYQLLNDLFLYNAQDCTFWLFDAFSDSLNGFLLMVEDNKPMEALLSFAYSIHKAPVAYYSCYALFEDYTSIVIFYNAAITTADQWGSYAVKVFWNLIFNWVDIFYELISLYRSLREREWTMIGKFIA